MKKVLALVLAFALVFTSIPVAFADTEVSAEAKALATIGMLQGDGNGVTVEYTAKDLNKLTAAIMILKLKGLYEDAVKYEGTNNFVDADKVAWAEGKNILAYVKDNPIGFGGNEKGEFGPYDTLSEQMYYKVLLENLGYKQTTADVAGDFAWEEVLTFAESIGLTPAKADKFTIDGLAKATVSALKAKTKDGKVWAQVLVEAGKIDKDLAIAAGILEEAKAVEVAVKSVKAIGNTVVEVEFEAEVEKAAAENLANYSIEGLEVKSALLDGTKKVLLETSAQTSGKTYTLVIGESKFNFGGKAKIAGAPELKKVTGTDTERVELEFDKVLDFETATNVENYSIANVKVVKATLNSDRTKVTLVTEGLGANKTHTIKVTNVKSVDGVALKSASKTFYSKSDKVAPKVEKAEALTYTRVLVKFNEELDKETAENVENYTIDKLTVEKAVLVADDSADEVERWVELTTSPQKAGTSYTVKVKGVKDTSVLGNEMVKEASAKFTGKVQDKTGPTVKKVEVLNRNKVLVEFSDASRLDFATVQDVNNYSFNKDIAVENAELTPGYTADTKKVILTVSDMADKTTYKLTITGVADEYGNEIKKVEKSFNYNNSQLDASKIKSVVAKSATKIEINFSKYLDPVTAKDVANYTINNDIGTPVSAKINDELNKVTLTVNELTEGKTYKVTINGVQDLAGNTLKTTASFVALTTENDIEAPQVEDITSVNRIVLRVTFSEPIAVKGNDKIIKAVIKEVRKNTEIELPLGAVYEGDKVLEFTNADKFEDVEYQLVGFKYVADKAGNKVAIDEELTFWGDVSVEENVDFSWEQVNVAKYRLTFSEKVKLIGTDANFVADDADALGMDTVWYLKKKVAVDKKAFDQNINDKFQTKHGIKINNTDDEKEGRTTIVASMEDTDAPYIENVEAEYRNKVRVYFNEDIQTYGKYEISYYDANGKLKKVTVNGSKDPDNDNGVILNLTNLSLKSRFTYTLKVVTPVQDLANNKSEKDEEYDFPGTDLVAPDNYILGVEITNGRNIKVKTFDKVDGATVTLYEGKKETPNEIKDIIVNVSGKEVTISLLKTALRLDVDYIVVVDGMEYKFEGTVSDNVTFYDDGNYTVITYSDMKETDEVYVNGAKATVNKDGNGKFVDFRVSKVEVKTILVLRDGVALYFFVEDGVDNPTVDTDEALADLLEALTNKNLRKIKLSNPGAVIDLKANNDLEGKLKIGRLVDIDFNGAEVKGDITFDTTEVGQMTISKGKINGDLVVNVPKADFVVGTGMTVTGNVTIKDVKSNSFYNEGVLGTVVVEAAKAIRLVNKNNIDKVAINTTSTVTLESARDITVENVLEDGKAKVVINGTTYELNKGGTIKTKDESVVKEVYDALDIKVAEGDTVEAVTKGFSVQVKDENKGVSISWESDDEDVVTIDENGNVKVTRPEDEDAVVTLTAKVQKGLVEMVREFIITVIKADKKN
ncbi:Ig-like domain-containing protein [Lutispora thermophila]|uniref:Ig-like domain-containing protein n=1 Tax=Lutispora thermophila DSM 19022 TaxID=1122184 RepID=A0A1M6BW62_9FIRM|nr:Ig-like domain-containing protein [Lutispora thermophila]SHI53026.1 Ig-like domain-containing protein [Lutispora thermophila DSM 19022]